MESNLDALERWIAVSIARLSPAEQRQLFRRVGEDLRRVNGRSPRGSDILCNQMILLRSSTQYEHLTRKHCG